MSIEADEPGQASGCEPADGAIALRISPRTTDLGALSVRRLLPARMQRKVGPWVFFDHFGPVEFDPGKGLDVRPHPHINLATVTYLFDGEILHRDSLGSLQAIEPGAVNLMIAGSGIVHSERERPEVRATRHHLHGLQLWLGLPEADEQLAPAFLHYPAGDIPSIRVGGVDVTVIMGGAYGLRSPVRTFAETLYIEARLPAGQALVTPAAEELAVYVVSGRISIDGDRVDEHVMAVLAPAANALIEASNDARIVLIGGAALGERFIEWNFVSSRRERIEQAKRDWQQGRFPAVPGDENQYIPLPD